MADHRGHFAHDPVMVPAAGSCFRLERQKGKAKKPAASAQRLIWGAA